jgi:hypothetical protein
VTKIKPVPCTHEELLEWFSYDERNLFWKKLPFSRIKVGDQAGSFDDRGYRIIGFKDKRYRESRLVWFYVKGIWSESDIDHINGIKDDNRIENLREATRSQNGCNRKTHRNNQSGFKNITWYKKKKKYQVRIKLNDDHIQIGTFKEDEIEQALMARDDALIKYHGEFAYLDSPPLFQFLHALVRKAR